MSEIEKLYENAGLSNIWVERYNDGYYEHEIRYNSYKEMINNMMKANDWTLTEAQEVAKKECRKEYPPFTAEKQLELIKWAARKQPKVEIGWSPAYGYWVENQTDTRYYFGDQFDNALVSLINYLWQDLTEEERKQIKEILE